MSLAGFPLVQDINQARNEKFDASLQDRPTSEVLSYALGHKAISLIAIPANAATATACTAGTILSACTLGALKVGVFAGTLGHYRLKFDTGCAWMGERALHSGWELGKNMVELAYDGYRSVRFGVRCIRKAAEAIGLGHVFRKVAEVAKRVFNAAAERVWEGVVVVGKREMQVDPEFTLDLKTPGLLNFINGPTKDSRIDAFSSDRPASQILKHTLLSSANIPINAAAFTLASAASVLSATAFAAKVALYSTTKIDVPLPTYVGQCLNAAGATGGNVVKDTCHTVGDGFLSIYKVSQALGIVKAVVKVMEVIAYIPVAIFGS